MTKVTRYHKTESTAGICNEIPDFKRDKTQHHFASTKHFHNSIQTTHKQHDEVAYGDRTEHAIIISSSAKFDLC